MAPLLRRSAGRSLPNDIFINETLPIENFPAHLPSTTLVSCSGADSADRSFLAIRERPLRNSAGHRLILCGIFDQALHARLNAALATASRSETPLTIDLSDVTFLDESCLRLLQRTQRSHSHVVFLVPATGPAAQMNASRPERDLLGKVRAFPVPTSTTAAVLQTSRV